MSIENGTRAQRCNAPAELSGLRRGEPSRVQAVSRLSSLFLVAGELRARRV